MYFLDYRFLAFVPLLAVVYWLVPGRARNWVLLAADVAWLSLFSPSTVAALAALSIVVVYPTVVIGARTRRTGVAWMGTVVLLVLATLLRAKDLFMPEIALSGSVLSDELLHWIGFSYFLLKAIHAMFASARAIVQPPSLVQLLQYVLFLPTLTSGPLYRVDVFVQQLEAPKRPTWAGLHDGLLRILIGMGKKVVIVPFLISAAATLHAGGHVKQPFAYLVTYAMLFLDFSGYSDIAIGIGRLLGFDVPENFKNPFTATTLTQFWRNWHATLGDWLRENVFIPLGGVRARGWQLSLIVLGSMLIVGIWHGFKPVFVLWGVYHGVMLLLENRLGVKPMRSHRTAWWRLAVRYAIVQAIVIGGMFAFIDGLSS